jgi:EAL domain-containing protein (putative c-di-GMP-specific phosphodiesterase class I)
VAALNDRVRAGEAQSMRPIAPPTAPRNRRADPTVSRAELEIHYEPVAALDGGAIVGAEALLRRRMPSGVVQIAARFLPLAEATGLLVEIGRRVLDRACGSAADWQALRRDAWVTVNLSRRQLEDPALAGWVEAVLARHALRADLLVLDVPEAVVADAALEGGPVLQHLREIADLGVRIAVDDVGTGPPAPTYLPFVPVSILKIDGRFVRGLDAEPGGKLVPAMIALAHESGLMALAEGIEQEEQAEALRALGCDLGQGYAIGRAMTADRVAERLRG